MVLVIKKGMTKEEIDELLKKIPPSSVSFVSDKPPIDATKYFDKIRFDLKNIVETQRRMRDDRNYSY
ncbi:MAG: hypothetical protein SFU87_09110 [Chitinophagaceae bacterium]|jgi:hypothetical protein|nr:hypothetical protein [Chitinophagaceae bacterium]